MPSLQDMNRALVGASRLLKHFPPEHLKRYANRAEIGSVLQALKRIFWFPGDLTVALESISQCEDSRWSWRSRSARFERVPPEVNIFSRSRNGFNKEAKQLEAAMLKAARRE